MSNCPAAPPTAWTDLMLSIGNKARVVRIEAQASARLTVEVRDGIPSAGHAQRIAFNARAESLAGGSGGGELQRAEGRAAMCSKDARVSMHSDAGASDCADELFRRA